MAGAAPLTDLGSPLVGQLKRHANEASDAPFGVKWGVDGVRIDSDGIRTWSSFDVTPSSHGRHHTGCEEQSCSQVSLRDHCLCVFGGVLIKDAVRCSIIEHFPPLK